MIKMIVYIIINHFIYLESSYFANVLKNHIYLSNNFDIVFIMPSTLSK